MVAEVAFASQIQIALHHHQITAEASEVQGFTGHQSTEAEVGLRIHHQSPGLCLAMIGLLVCTIQ